MKSYEDLHGLVRSLTPAEKRYFKVTSAKADGKSNPLKLFEALDSMDEFDDSRLRKKLKGQALLKHLSSEKHTFYDALMRAMRAYHSDKSVDTRIFELMQDEVFLRGKGLNDLRGEILAEAEGLARKYEKYTYLLEVLIAQKDLITEFEEKKLTDRLGKKLEEIEKIVCVQHDLARLTLLNAEMFMTVRSGADLKNGDNRQRLETLVSEVRSFEDRVEGSFLLRMKYLGSLSHYHVCIGDREQAFLAVSQQLETCEAHPLMLKEEGQLYKTTLANYLTRAHSYRDFSRFEERLKIFKGLPTDTFYAEGEVFQNVCFIEHLYYINHGRFEEAEALVPVIEKGLVTYARKINKARVLSFCYNIMVMYFLMHRFREARAWSDRILNDKTDIRQDMQTANRILYPIICYELGKFDILDNITRSAYRYLLAQERLHEFERLVIRYLQTMPFTPDSDDFSEKLKAFEDELEIMKASEHKTRTAGMEEVELWIRSKREGRLMRELL